MTRARAASYCIIALSGVWLCWVTWASTDLAQWYARQGVRISDPLILFAIGGTALAAAAVADWWGRRALAVSIAVAVFFFAAMSWVGMTR